MASFVIMEPPAGSKVETVIVKDGFAVLGFLMPPLWLAQVLFYGFVITRLAHFVAYFTAQNHEIRAALWTPGSLVIIFLAGASLLAAF